MKLKRSLYLLLALFILMLTACSQNKKQADNVKISIVTTTNIYSDIAQNVVGKYGKASAIITKSNVDPHDFEPTTADAKKLSQASIIVENGLGYDDWMNKLASSVSKKPVSVGKLMGLKAGANPHLWYNLTMPEKYVDYLVRRLSKLDKKHAHYYRQNGQKYLAKVEQIKQLAKSINGKNKKPVYVSEPVFDYALQEAGFKIGDPDFEEAIENGTDPSAKVVGEMTKRIKQRKISFFVNNTQASSATVSGFVRLAKKNHIPILNVRETIPDKTTYLQWLRDNYIKLAKISQE